MDFEVLCETRTCVFSRNQNGINSVAYKRNIEETMTDAQNNYGVYLKLLKGTKSFTMIDLTEIRSINREARELYSAPQIAESTHALALLIDKPISRIIGNFMIGLNKPPIPTKLFHSPEKATSWLLKIKAVTPNLVE